VPWRFPGHMAAFPNVSGHGASKTRAKALMFRFSDRLAQCLDFRGRRDKPGDDGSM
jgi:hypothetical protein